MNTMEKLKSKIKQVNIQGKITQIMQQKGGQQQQQ